MSTPIPVAKGRPLVGLLPDFLRDPFTYVKQVAAFGDLVEVHLGGLTITYVFHPDYAEHVLVKNHRNYIKGQLMKRSELFFGRGLLTAEGDAWRQQRRRMAASFRPKNIDVFADEIALSGGRFLDTVSGERDVGADCMTLTLSIVLDLLFGRDQSERFDVLGKAFDEVADFFAATGEFFLQLPLWVPTPRNIRFKRAHAQLDDIIQRIIDDRRASASPPRDLLHRLLAESDDGSPVDEALIRDEIRTLMLAGHETTSLAIAFSLWFLSAEPERQDALRVEINAITGGGPVRGEHLAALSGVERVVKEAIRILPPAPILPREPIADDTIGPYTVKAGRTLILSPFRTQNDPRWFADPEAFRPERWTPEFEAGLPRFAFYPFGGGPRICIGMRMAMMEAVLIVAEYIRRFEVQRTDASELNLKPSITLRFGAPLRLRFVQVPH